MSDVRPLLSMLVREEWRRHTRLFGGPRFGLFPLLMAALASLAIWGLRWTGTPLSDILQGTYVLVGILGLYTGSAGLTGRDALHGVLGDVTLVMETIGSVPISLRRALSVFLVAEVSYYSALFLAPVTFAFALAGAIPLADLPPLLLSVVVTFALGVSVTLVLLGAATRGIHARAIVLGTAIGAVGLWIAFPPARSISPTSLYPAPATLPALGLIGLAIGLAGIGVAVADPTRASAPRRASDRFGGLRRRFHDQPGLLTKTILDVHRSDGGLWKVLFSGGILFGVAVVLVSGVERITGVRPSVGVAVGALLSLSAFTTFNWVTQFDGVDTYASLPVSTSAIFAAKGRAFALLGVPTILAFVALAGALFSPPPAELAVGAVLAIGIGGYLVGLTALLTGLRPGSFLLDPARYLAFTIGVAIVLVPVLIVGFVFVPIPDGVLVGLGVLGVVAGLGGYALYRLAVLRWTRRYRTAEF